MLSSNKSPQGTLLSEQSAQEKYFGNLCMLYFFTVVDALILNGPQSYSVLVRFSFAGTKFPIPSIYRKRGLI